jgi:hypothetical protein
LDLNNCIFTNLYLEWHEEAITQEHVDALDCEDQMDQMAIQHFIDEGAGRTIEELEEDKYFNTKENLLWFSILDPRRFSVSNLDWLCKFKFLYVCRY